MYCFLQPNILPKLSKISVTCSKSVQMIMWTPFWLAHSQQNDYQFWTAQSQQNDQFENLYISSYGEARNIKFGQQVNLIQGVPLGSLSQEVLMSLPYTGLLPGWKNCKRWKKWEMDLILIVGWKSWKDIAFSALWLEKLNFLGIWNWWFSKTRESR